MLFVQKPSSPKSTCSVVFSGPESRCFPLVWPAMSGWSDHVIVGLRASTEGTVARRVAHLVIASACNLGLSWPILMKNTLKQEQTWQSWWISKRETIWGFLCARNFGRFSAWEVQDHGGKSKEGTHVDLYLWSRDHGTHVYVALAQVDMAIEHPSRYGNNWEPFILLSRLNDWLDCRLIELNRWTDPFSLHAELAWWNQGSDGSELLPDIAWKVVFDRRGCHVHFYALVRPKVAVPIPVTYGGQNCKIPFQPFPQETGLTSSLFSAWCGRSWGYASKWKIIVQRPNLVEWWWSQTAVAAELVFFPSPGANSQQE